MIKISIPQKKDVLKATCSLRTVSGKWLQTCLKSMEGERGVYIFHKGMEVLYVGKTGGKTMTFGIRLRRHFQKKAAQKGRIWKLLKKYEPVGVSFIIDEQICRRITGARINTKQLEDEGIRLMEAALILCWEPIFQPRVGSRNSN
jgi:hypothetical protein